MESVGDVKYSILDPVTFLGLEENQGKWMELRRDNALPADCDLAAYWVGKPLPDARGVFVRGMNQDQVPDLGDPEGNRNPGDPQRDAFQGHHHRFASRGQESSYTFPLTTNFDVGDKGGVNFADSANPVGGSIGVGSAIPDGKNGDVIVAKETRPRNIALYVYVRINK